MALHLDVAANRAVAVTEDSRILCYHTASVGEAPPLQVFKEKAMLATLYTASAINTVMVDDVAKPLLAAGTSGGIVVVWDLQRGEVIHRLGESADRRHHTAVTALAWQPGSHVLYSAAEGSPEIIAWDASVGTAVKTFKGDKNGTSAMVVTSDGAILFAASTDIHVISTSTGKKAHRLQGHGNSVTSLALTDDNTTLVSASTERNVCVWDSASISARSHPVAVLLHPNTPTSLHCVRTQQGKKKTALHVVAASEDGGAVIWRYRKRKNDVTDDANGAPASKPVQPSTYVTLDLSEAASAPGGEPPKVLAARLARGEGGDVTLIAAVGPLTSLSCYRSNYADSDGHLLPSVVLKVVPPTAGVSSSSSKKRRRDKGAGAHVGVAKQAVVAPAALRQDEAAGDENDVTPDATEGQTLGERLAAVVSAIRGVSSAYPPAPSARPATGTPSVAAAISTTGSLQSVLEQALHSGDDTQLELVLGHSDKTIVRNTVLRLSPNYVLAFLGKVVAKLQSSPGRGVHLAIWLRALLTSHTGYLLTLPDLVDRVSGLYSLLDGRLAVYKKLLKLSGRLDLVMSQLGVTLSEGAGEATSFHRVVKKARLVVKQAELDAEAAMPRHASGPISNEDLGGSPHDDDDDGDAAVDDDDDSGKDSSEGDGEPAADEDDEEEEEDDDEDEDDD